MSMRLAHRIGLRGRLILLLLAAFGVIFAFIAEHMINHRAGEISNATLHLQHKVQLIAGRQQSIAVYADALLSELMLASELHPLVSADECSRKLAKQLGREKMFSQIGMVLPDGNIACAAIPPNGPVNVSDRPWFQQALKTDDLVISDALTGRILGKKIVLFAKTRRDTAGRAAAVFYAALDLDWLRQALAGSDLPEDAHLMVVDSQGTIMARYPDADGMIGKNVAHMPYVRNILASKGEGTVEAVALDGKLRIISFTPFLGTPSNRMVLWLSVPKSVVTEHAQRGMETAVFFFSALLLLVMGLVYWTSEKQLVRPLLVLSRNFARFGAGERSTRSGLPHYDNDIGRLARTLDEMAEGIQAGEKHLSRANHALRVLSAGNRAMLRTEGEQELAEAMCRAIVEAGDYRLSWAAYAGNDPGKSVWPTVIWGSNFDFFEGLQLTWNEAVAREPAGMAICRGMPMLSNSIPGDPDCAVWHGRALRYGFASMLALPLRIDGAVIGVLVICAAEQNAFDPEVIKLLWESADDLAFGIEAQRTEAGHKAMQDRLKKTEEHFRVATEASLDALFILDCVRGTDGGIIDFRFTDVNRCAEQLLGMAREQIIGQKLCELIPFTRTGGFFDKYVAVAATGKPLDEEFPVDSPQIRAAWLRHQVVRIGDGIAIFSRDVTPWKEAGAVLRRLEKQNTLILSSIGEGIFGLDLEGRATFINPAGAAMLQWPVEALHGRVMHDTCHHTKADGTPYPYRECPVHAAHRDGVTHHGSDEVFWRKDGTSFPVEYVSTPIRDEQGGVQGAVVSFSDITWRRENEKALARLIRALKTLSATNMALVRATSEQALLETVCKIVVDKGGYRFAWVGYADDNPEKTITPKAWGGIDEASLARLNLTWDDSGSGDEPIGRAIRSGESLVIHDIATVQGCVACRELAGGQAANAVFVAPLWVNGKVVGAMEIYANDASAFDEHEIKLLKEMGGDLAFGIESLRIRAERDRTAYQHLHHAEILQRSLEQSIQAIAGIVDARDPYTAGHQRRVSELAVAIAREMGLVEEKTHGLRLAATVHDLGKIHIPAEILAKPGRITDIELMLIKTHSQAGYDILKEVEFPWPIAEMVWQHHEKLDGSGYPQGISGKEILLESRILTVADVVEAMSSHRPYRPALGIEVALKEIERGRGSIYDPAVADACLKIFREGGFVLQT
jgi:PAS domain S-box-containing protein